jgi:hypothetical protein
MLLGAKLHVHTDHKNILSIEDSSQLCPCWISYVDEYGLEIHYVEGPCNVIADTFLRLLHSNVSSPLVGKKTANVDTNSESDNRYESSHSLLMDVGSHYKVRSRTVSSLAAEYLVGGFMICSTLAF